MTTITNDVIMEAVATVEHPEISMSLVDLGMVRDVDYDPKRNAARATLVIPFMGIPEVIRNILLQSLYDAMKSTGVDVVEFDIAEMSPEERQAFFVKEHSHWRG